MEVLIDPSSFPPASAAVLLQCRVGSRLVFAVDAAWDIVFDSGGRGTSATRVASDAAPYASSWPHAGLEVERWEVVANRAGPLRFVVTVRGNTKERVGDGIVIVSPQLRVGDALIPPEALCVKTVLTRCLGPLSGWLAPLRQVRASGYNAVHFTPMQVLGSSGSAYCVADHATPMPNVQASWQELGAFLKQLRTEEGLLSLTDLVWNHAASDCGWLLQHPECGYCVSLDVQQPCNSPHLRAALDLDLALQRLQQDMRDGLVPGLPRAVKTSEDLELVLRHVGTTLWESLRLWEYFVLDETLVDRFPSALLTKRAPGSFEQLLEQLELRGLVEARVGQRFGWALDEAVVAELFDNVGEFRKG
jgi:hypothetical protein